MERPINPTITLIQLVDLLERYNNAAKSLRLLQIGHNAMFTVIVIDEDNSRFNVSIPCLRGMTLYNAALDIAEQEFFRLRDAIVAVVPTIELLPIDQIKIKPKGE